MNRIFLGELPRNCRGFARIVGKGAAAVVLLLPGCGQQAEAPVTLAQVQPAPQAPRPAVPLSQRAASRPESNEALAVSTNLTSQLPIYEIRMKPEDLAAIDENAYGKNLYPATFIADGVVYENVKIRYRGAWARSW